MKSLSTQKGLTLIELIIAAALGMTIAFFIINILTTSARTANTSDGLAQAQENGRFILNWLTNEIRPAGFNTELGEPKTQPFADSCASDLPRPPSNNADCSYQTHTAPGDRIAIKRTFSNETDRSKRDCTGVDLNSTRTNGDVLTDVYWVEHNFVIAGTTTPDAYDDVLRCVTYFNGIPVAPAQVIASGIESMQVLYGIKHDSVNFESNVHRFISSNEITPFNWDNVRALRISILTRSFTDGVLPVANRSYILLNADPLTFNDMITRNIQTTTIYLLNE